MSAVTNASNDANSSVMISRIKTFYNLGHLGVTLKMNSDGVNMVNVTQL